MKARCWMDSRGSTRNSRLRPTIFASHEVYQGCVGTFFFALLLVLGMGCGHHNEQLTEDTPIVVDAGGAKETGDADGGSAPVGWLYDESHLLEIDLTLDSADWDLIRTETRTSTCVNANFEFTTVPTELSVDGQTFPRVGVRKKGSRGSLSSTRPSLHIDMNEYTSSTRIDGQKVLTLNNCRQDRSLAKQCLAYEVFRAAGLPAPRCSFAHVRVNGEDLGIYANIEPVKKPFLARYYANNDGNLYEGSSGADFRDDKLGQFEKKTNEDSPPSGELQALADALKSTMGTEQAIEALVDVPEFMRFWAVESLIGHWDGYAGNLNNFFVYQDPTTQKMSFIPWGTDQAFSSTHPFLSNSRNVPKSVYARAHLPNLLYAEETPREEYRNTLRSVLASAWDETALLAHIDRIAALLGDFASARDLDTLRNFVQTRRAEVEAELARPAQPWTSGEPTARQCTTEP